MKKWRKKWFAHLYPLSLSCNFFLLSLSKQEKKKCICNKHCARSLICFFSPLWYGMHVWIWCAHIYIACAHVMCAYDVCVLMMWCVMCVGCMCAYDVHMHLVSVWFCFVSVDTFYFIFYFYFIFVFFHVCIASVCFSLVSVDYVSCVQTKPGDDVCKLNQVMMSAN